MMRGMRAPRDRLMSLSVLVLAVLACIAWSALEGPSWSWDRAHYHEYAGYQWLYDRLGSGFMPAGPQTMLNPLAHVPRALMGACGWSELAVASMLAAVQALNVWCLWWIARDRIPGAVGPALAAVIALLTPVFLSQLGTSYIDASTGLGILAGVWACRRAGDSDRSAWRWAALGGLAMGAAAGLKLSNALPALVAPILFVGAWHGARVGTRAARIGGALLAFGLGGAIGVAVTLGGWGSQVYRIHGNPIFPIADHVFNPIPAAHAPPPAPAAAPVAAPGPLARLERVAMLARASGSRFVPQSFTDALWLPWRMADPTLPMNMAYVEWHAPDPRAAIVMSLALVLLLRGALGQPRRAGAPPGPPSAARIDLPLWAFVAAWWVVWVHSSANGRYGVSLLMLAAVPIVQAIWVLVPTGRWRAAAVSSLLVICTAYGVLIQDRSDIVAGGRWEDGALRANLPASMREAPALHVSLGFFSWSYLLPKMHPQSSIATFASLCRGSGCPHGNSTALMASVLREWRGQLRLIAPVDALSDGQPRLSDAARRAMDMQLAEFELRIDAQRCDAFEVRPNLANAWLAEPTSTGETVRPSDWVASCALVEAAGAQAAAAALRDRHAAVFRTLERACPNELGAPTGVTQWIGEDSWFQLYLERDIRVKIDRSQVSAMRLRRSTRMLGSVEALSSPGAVVDCRSLNWAPDVRWPASEALVFEPPPSIRAK
jgi:hypothetical protein